jgi:hypothetical protein
MNPISEIDQIEIIEKILKNLDVNHILFSKP